MLTIIGLKCLVVHNHNRGIKLKLLAHLRDRFKICKYVENDRIE